ncbi:MAG: MG2 domain-containing protein, partial [Bacteroidota bacterium]
MNLKRWAFIGILFWAGNGLMAQKLDSSFSKQWNEIDSLLGISHLPKSALDKVNQIYELAEKNSNNVQKIKALLYRTAIEINVAEFDINKNISAFKLELGKTKDPSCRALIHVLIAKQYQKYFNDHRWQLYDRSKIKTQNTTDILSWSADDFLKHIEAEYDYSLTEKDDLKKTKLNAYGAILWKGNAEYLRPTLYDVIAQDALDYFKSGQESKTTAKNNFTVRQQASLGNYAEFASLKLISNDSNAHTFRALQLFQDLTLFHINDAQKDALIDLDIDRINWVYQQAIFENKQQLKEKALTAITTDFESNAAVYAWLQLAKDKTDLAATYQPFQDSSERWQYLAAIKLIDAAIKKFADKNPVKNQLENLKQRILLKDVSIHSEKIDLPNKPFKVLVEYKNVDTLYLRILAVPIEFTKSNNNGEQLINQLCNKNSIQSSEQWLPVTNDYQNHFVEIKLDPLSQGEYVLLASTGKNFNPARDIINYQSFQVSSISLIQNKSDFFVLNRETGNPISKANITILSRTSNAQRKEWDNEGVRSTDENGYVKMDGQKSNRYYSFIIESKNEKFRTIDPTWFENEQNPKKLTDSIHFEKRNQRTFFFTDRSIYRPGQIVYFKAIISTIDFNNQKSKLLAKTNATVFLRDVNYRIIDSLKFISNDYGSYHGKFTLPEKI